MTNNVNYLNTLADTPDMSRILACTQLHLRTWQSGQLKFVTPLHHLLKQYVDLFLTAQDETRLAAQRIVIELDKDLVGKVRAVLEKKPEQLKTLLPTVEKELGSIAGRLNAQVEAFNRQHSACTAIAALDMTQSTAVHKAEREKLQVEQTRLAAEKKRQEQVLAEVEKAVNALEENGLKTDFKGVVPDAKALLDAVAAGGKVAAGANAMGDAIKTLSRAFGEVVERMEYTRLQSKRKAFRDKVQALNVALTECNDQMVEVERRLEILESSSRLGADQLAWAQDNNKIALALKGFHTQLEQIGIDGVEDMIVLADVLSRLKSYQKALLVHNH